MICVRDPAGYSNASTYGTMRYGGARWAQIGESPNHRFCGWQRSPLENIMQSLDKPPKLMIFHFLGLSAFRWANRANIEADLAGVDEQLPPQSACMFLTTIPAYRADINRPRIKAQANLETALNEASHRCGFVAGVTDQTIRAFQGNPAYYYRRKNGRVKDPYHTTPGGAAEFLRHRGSAICRGVVEALTATLPVQ